MKKLFVFVCVSVKLHIMLLWGSRGLMVRVSGPAGIVGGGSECLINGCPLLRVCVCSLLCVCTLDGLIAEHKF